jgi:hypothetical protein
VVSVTTSDGSDTATQGIEAVREQRDDLEALADTDLPVAKWAERLLSLLDGTADGGGQM